MTQNYKDTSSWSYLQSSNPQKPVGGSEDEVGVYPLDEYNVKLLDLVAPREWTNPSPSDDFVYDLVAIGAGAGGLVSAKQSARRGFRSALIEKHLAGGDCLNIGCVPSKSLLSSAKEMRHIFDLEVRVESSFEDKNIRFLEVMKRMRRLRAKIAPADSYEGAKAVGVDVYQGEAKFISKTQVQVGTKILNFKKCVIATGGRADIPQSIEGIHNVSFFTNANIFNINYLPRHIVIVGGGPVACELGQAFNIFGSQVTFVLRSTLLSTEDDDARIILEDEFQNLSGIECYKHSNVTEVKTLQGNQMEVSVKSNDSLIKLECDALFIAAGRVPNVENLNLESAMVNYNLKDGVLINDYLQTSNPNIYAVGDVCSKMKFTHLSGKHAQMVVENTLFDGHMRNSDLVVPHVTYTYPEIARVGLNEKEADSRNIPYNKYIAKLVHNDRAIVEEIENGFVKILCERSSDKIIGATIVAPNAGEMISELTLAIQFNIGLGMDGLGNVIHSYPTLSGAIEGCAFQFKLKHWKHRDGYKHKYRKSKPVSYDQNTLIAACVSTFLITTVISFVVAKHA